MASFDPSERQPVAEASSTRGPLPHHFFESKLQRFLNCYPQLIEQLQKHASNLREYHRRNDHTRMRAEMISASHTVNRGQSSQQEFKQVRSQIPIDLLEKYENRFSQCSTALKRAVDALHNVAKQLSEQTSSTSTAGVPSASSNQRVSGDSDTSSRTQSSHSSYSSASSMHPHCIASQSGSLQFFCTEEDQAALAETSSVDEAAPGSQLSDLSVTRAPGDMAARAQDLNVLFQDVTELNELIHVFANSVQEQRQFVDSISTHVDDAAVSVNEGAQSLGMAAKLKAVMIPVTCGAVGAVIAGPVGLIAGFKLGAVAAAGAAGVGGVLIGRRIKSRKDKQIAEDMGQLEHS